MKNLRAIACAVFLAALPLLTAGCAAHNNAVAELQGKPVFFRLVPCEPPYPEHQYQIDPQPHWYMPPSRLVEEDEYNAWRESQLSSGNYAELQMDHAIDGRYPVPNPLPYPESIDDLPANDRGVELYLTVRKRIMRDRAGADVYQVRVTLSTDTLMVHEHVMHRYGVDPPILFAVYFDGVAWEGEPTGFEMQGGMDDYRPIAEPHHPKTWRFSIALYPFLDRVPDGVKEVTLVAVYAERLLVGYVPGPHQHLQMLATHYLERDRPVILVRSNPVTLRLGSD